MCGLTGINQKEGKEEDEEDFMVAQFSQVNGMRGKYRFQSGFEC